MKPLNELNKLFGTGETIEYLYTNQLLTFKDHPFKVNHDADMDKLIESVKLNGIISPIIVRESLVKGSFEIISGHRRTYAAKIAGLEKIPAVIKDMTDDEAIIAMVDANNQREVITPSEKAWAYKMKMDAMKRKAGRPTKDNSRQVVGNYDNSDLNSRQVVGNSETADLIGADSGESGRQVQRYIRLTNLHPRLLELVDNGTIKVNPAVQLSYLSSEAQENLLTALDYEEKYQISLATANKIRNSYDDGQYSCDNFMSIIYPNTIETKKEEKFYSISMKFDIPYELHGIVKEEDIKRIIDNYILQVGRRS